MERTAPLISATACDQTIKWSVGSNLSRYFSMLIPPQQQGEPRWHFGPLQPQRLFDAIQGPYRFYMAQVAIPEMEFLYVPRHVHCCLSQHKWVLGQDWKSKLAVQILLAVILFVEFPLAHSSMSRRSHRPVTRATSLA